MALKLQEEYQDSMQVVFVEVGRVDNDGMQAFAIDKGWFAASDDAMWTKDRPFDVGAGGIPAYALLDDQGKVLMKGITTADHSKIVEAIEEHAKARGKGRSDLPGAVGKAYGDFWKGKAGKALAEVSALAAEGSRAEAEVLAAAKATVTSMEAALEVQLKRVDWLVENGYFARAETALAALEKSWKGAEAWVAKLQERRTKLGSPDLVTERKAEEALLKIQEKLFAKGTEGVKPKVLSELAQKFPGTKAAARADQLIAVIEASGAG